MTEMDQTSPTSSLAATRRTYSCIRCSDRKVKCDRQQPTCNNCLKHNVECIFRPPPPRSSRKRKRVEHDVTRTQQTLSNDKDSERATGVHPTVNGVSPSQLPDLVRNDEVVVRDDRMLPPTPVSITSDQQKPPSRAQLIHVQDRSKFVDNTLWSSVVEEVHDPEVAFEEGSSEANDSELSDDDYGFALGMNVRGRHSSSHPSQDHMKQLWQIFAENVDPMTKIVHVPSLSKAVDKAMADIKNIPRSFDALLFAIYSTAIMSLKDQECIRRFNEPRKVLFSKFTRATKAALARAKFLGSVSLVVLQALTLHLVSVRETLEPRSLWTLCGVAIRLAESMGLHRDGASLGLPPFESEIRRRIWWFLLMTDFRTAELCGLPKFRSSEPKFDTYKLPANINDEQIYPGMISPPVESDKLTDMIFVISRVTFFAFAMENRSRYMEQEKHKGEWVGSVSRTAIVDKAKFVEHVEELLESRFLRYCDPSQPLELMAMHDGRALLHATRFMISHPRGWIERDHVPESERRTIWELCLKMLEQYQSMQTSPQLRQFAWNVPYSWHALIHALNTLRSEPLITGEEKAWRLIESFYEHNPNVLNNTKRAVHVAVGNLCLKAYQARENSRRDRSNELPVPRFINELRLQREAARARREKNSNVNKVVPTSSDGEQSKSKDQLSGINQVMPVGNVNPTTFEQNGTLWSTEGFDHLLGTAAADMMHVDTDYMLSHDFSWENTPGQQINWTQWDAWVGDMNVMPTAIGTSFNNGTV